MEMLPGNGGPGGTVMKAKKPLISSGACTMNSRYHFMMSAASSISQSMGPAQTVCTGCAWNRNEVTMPKFPPPPRMAQNRSLFSSGARHHKTAVGEHQVGGEQIVDGQAVLSRQMTHAAAERQPADPGSGDNPRRDGQSKGVRGVIDLAPCASASDAHRL